MDNPINGPHPGNGTPPSMLDLVRLSPRPLLPSGGPELYRQIAALTGMRSGQDLMVTPCGAGLSLELLVREVGVQGFGADPDAGLVEEARARARQEELEASLQYETAPPHNLPYRDEIFDVVLGEVGATSAASPRDVVEELVRVTRPGGRLALVQPVWRASVDPERRERVASRLGTRILRLTEWKGLLREAGVESLHSESWSGEGPGRSAGVPAPFPDFADLLGVREKLGAVGRAWKRWGFQGVYRALVREAEVHRVLTREGLLGLTVILGSKADVPIQVGSSGGTVASSSQWSGPGEPSHPSISRPSAP